MMLVISFIYKKWSFKMFRNTLGSCIFWSTIVSVQAEVHEKIPVNSVVRIEVTSFSYNYSAPWMQPAIQKSSGTGFIIAGNQILTNAHVVSGADDIRVSLSFHRTDYKARVLYIAHDCDLALLEVENKSFFKNTKNLEIGRDVELNSPVAVVGYPIGGDRISITRGVVSRIGMEMYSHSEIDYHMTIQVDAAINPGNSGGPALQNGRVIGVAFQARRSGENLGYLIPPVVIRKFLKDIEDGKYNGYIELGVMHQTTVNSVMQKALGFGTSVQSPDTGVLVYAVIPGASADGFILPGDVLLEINHKKISENGDVDIDQMQQSFSLVVDNLESGEIIHAKIWRDGKIRELSFPAHPTSAFDHMRKNYDTPPEYAIANGFVFQPLNSNLMSAYAKSWSKFPELLYRYNYFISGKIYKEVDEDVVLTRRLEDPSNSYSDRYVYSIVLRVNGQKIRNFREFWHYFDLALNKSSRVLIEFLDQDVPLILHKKDLMASESRIRQKYGIQDMQYVSQTPKKVSK